MKEYDLKSFIILSFLFLIFSCSSATVDFNNDFKADITQITINGKTGLLIDYDEVPTTLTVPPMIAGIDVISIKIHGASGFSSLYSVTFPKPLMKVDSFEENTKIESLKFTENFYELPLCTACTSLTEVYIPASISEIPENCFLDCSKLETIYCYALTPPTIGENAFSTSSTSDNEIIYTPNQNNYNLIVPEESVKIYTSCDGWKDFKSIEGM